jgi:NADH dehydrogenase
MRVAVFGASGFVGRYVSAALVEQGHEVVGFGRTRAGGGQIAFDIVTAPPPLAALSGCDAIVNLIGIKREVAAQTFEAAHVGVVEKLIAAAKAARITRVVHVSVVCSRPDPTSPYHDTKWRAEQLWHASQLDVTVLRPGVVYGRGDDMLTHLVKMIRFIPLFPVVGGGRSLLQPVDVRDVAKAVVAALESRQAVGKTYDVVGRDRLELGAIVRTIADALGLPLLIVPTPRPLMRTAVAWMEQLMSQPLSTPSQLRMLEEGLVGDPEPMRRELGIEPRALTPAAVREATGDVEPLFGQSLRLLDRPEATAWLARGTASTRAAALVALLGIALQTVFSFAIPGIWIGMLAGMAILVPAAVIGVRLPWGELLRPTLGRVLTGVTAAALLYGAGFLVVQGLLTQPWGVDQVATLYGWRDAAPPQWAVVFLVLIVIGEDVVWRAAVTLPLAARLGPWPGVFLSALAFALAHVSRGVPVLVAAAFLAGAFWSALTIRSRSLVAPLVSHLLWDVAVMFWFPY